MFLGRKWRGGKIVLQESYDFTAIRQSLKILGNPNIFVKQNKKPINMPLISIDGYALHCCKQKACTLSVCQVAFGA